MALLIPETVKNIKSNIFAKVQNVKMDLTFGDDISIEDSAFEQCTGLTSLKFTGSVKKIGDSSFRGCTGLTTLSTIDVEHIGSNAFNGCSNLKGKLSLSPNTKSLGDSTFSECSQLSGELTIPSSIESIGHSCFY